jgi:hypothetical protein
MFSADLSHTRHTVPGRCSETFWPTNPLRFVASHKGLEAEAALSAKAAWGIRADLLVAEHRFSTQAAVLAAAAAVPAGAAPQRPAAVPPRGAGTCVQRQTISGGQIAISTSSNNVCGLNYKLGNDNAERDSFTISVH